MILNSTFHYYTSNLFLWSIVRLKIYINGQYGLYYCYRWPLLTLCLANIRENHAKVKRNSSITLNNESQCFTENSGKIIGHFILPRSILPHVQLITNMLFTIVLGVKWNQQVRKWNVLRQALNEFNYDFNAT